VGHGQINSFHDEQGPSGLSAQGGALPGNVKHVEITKIGRSRLISPVGHSWDAFFASGGIVDFPEREQPKPEKRKRL
jgi:antitoxin VapB